MEQIEITVRPIIQLTGGSEFNETFFDSAKTKEENVVGGKGNGWKVAMGTLAFERGASTLGQQTSFRQELDELINTASLTGAWENAVLRQKVVDLYIGLEVLRFNQLRMLTALVVDGVPGAEQSIGKLFGLLGIGNLVNYGWKFVEHQVWSLRLMGMAATKAFHSFLIRNSEHSYIVELTQSMEEVTKFKGISLVSEFLACLKNHDSNLG